MSLMMSSCCTFRLNRRRALSMDSPSWIFTSATKYHTPFVGGQMCTQSNMLGYHE